MAQSATTVTPPSPTPPTNMSFTGVTGPNPTNYTKNTYTNPVANPPPYYDDAAGGVGTRVAFNANTSALAGGTGATSGGTENSYPGTDTAPFDTPNRIGAVPASTSVAHEGAGIETAKTYTYATGILVPGLATTYQPTAADAWTEGTSPGGPLKTNGVSPALTIGTMPQPNGTHASTLSPSTNPALASISPTTAVSGATGSDTITCTGTNFTPQSVVYRDGIAMPTTYVSATSVTASVTKRATAGASAITVVTGGAVITSPQTLTYS